MSKGGKGKGKGKGKGEDAGQEQEEKIQLLEHKVRALQAKHVEEQIRADKGKGSENEQRGRLFELRKDFEYEKEKLFCIVYLNIHFNVISSDMTRQYKQMQDELLKEINELKRTVIEKDEIIKSKEQYIQDLIKDYEYRLKKKDDEINDLKRRIEEMSAEFAKMLKDTLDKMQDRIELAQWDNDSDPQIMKRLKDIAGLQNN